MISKTQDPTVIIIGCGIAGPVLALLLQQKGYRPCVVEKVRQLGDAGGSIYMQPNGLKVLALVGLLDEALKGANPVKELRDMKSTGEALGSTNLPSEFEELYRHSAAGIARTHLNLSLKDALIRKGIPLHEGWRLQDILETETGVTAISADGRRLEGSFLVGCDGLKAVTRELLLKRKGLPKEAATFTGLIQEGGYSPMPASMNRTSGMDNWYGPGAHVITYPTAGGFASWAITSRDSEAAEESWRPWSAEDLPARKEALLKEFDSWCTPVKELIGGAQRLIKYGLYDRPGLSAEQWYDGRCVLIGDAAHPTSPHLGQGGNQALEDCYHLSQMLPEPSSNTPLLLTTEALTAVFRAFAKKRQPRTAALVKGARVQGELRVVGGGPAACEDRDETLRQQWKNESALRAKFDGLLKEPFQ